MKSGEGIWAEIDELISLRAYASLIFKGAEKKSSSPLAGGYVSPFRGRGIDFSEVRLYQAGDEIRAMDWRVTARTGKPHTKLFIEERERSVFFIQDFSPAMFFATRNALKTVVASKITAMLAWAAVGHGDRVGAALFNNDETTILKPTGGNRGVLRLINKLSTWSKALPSSFADKDTDFAKVLRLLRSTVRPGSLVYLISDFKAFNRESQMLLSEIARHVDIVAIRIVDPIELQIPEHAQLKITDGDRFSEVNTENKDTLRNLHLQVQLSEQKFISFCIKHGIHSLTCHTDDDILEVLRRGLAKRQSMRTMDVQHAGVI